MRRSPLVLALSLLTLAFVARPAVAETTRTVRVELPAGAAAAFKIENLAGSMRVIPGSGSAVVAIATVHAESDELAQSVRVEEVRDEGGLPTLRVRYPLDRHPTIRYPHDDATGEPIRRSAFTVSSTMVKYDGQRVRVSRNSGALVYADVEVQVPRALKDATFRNVVGPLRGERLKGKLKFDTDSGNVTIGELRGDILADTGSGDVVATGIDGSFKCDTGSGDCALSVFRGREAACHTGSGDCNLSGLEGESLACDTGSGDVRVRSSNLGKVVADTGSGDIELLDLDAEDLTAKTGSGDVTLKTRGGRLARVAADSGSGDVRLTLAADASFEARVDQGSGDIVNRFPGAQAIVQGKEVIGYRRGDGRIRISVDTGSGDLILEPRGQEHAEARLRASGE